MFKIGCTVTYVHYACKMQVGNNAKQEILVLVQKLEDICHKETEALRISPETQLKVELHPVVRKWQHSDTFKYINQLPLVSEWRANLSKT